LKIVFTFFSWVADVKVLFYGYTGLDMEKIAPVIVLSIVVPALLIVLFFFVCIRLKRVRDDRVPFECGFDPKSSARVPFSLRFFLLAVIFLIFDVEVSLLFPLCYSIVLSVKVETLLSLFVFLLVILGGLFLE
jgi:NADH-ubiquinone oxidoreductase chain 3